MDFGQRLKQLREHAGLTQKELAEKFNITSQALCKYEGGRVPNEKILTQIATFFGVSTDYLLGLTNQPKFSRELIPAGPMVKLPVLGVIRAGEPLYAEQNIIDYEWIPESDVQGGEHFFLRVKGDSMEPKIPEGCNVLVRKQETIENGEIAVVMNGEGEAVIKKVIFSGDTVVLQSLNPKYPPLIWKASQTKIIGKAKKMVCEL